MTTRAATSLTKVIALADAPDTAPIELAKALWVAVQQEPSNLAKIIEQTKLGRRKAYYLLSIWRRFAGRGIPEEHLAFIGWTKLQVIAQHCEESKEQVGLDLSLRCTAAELKQALQGGKHPANKTHSLLFRLSPSQYKVLRTALIAHGATPSKNGRGLDGKEKALIKAVKAALS